MKYEVQHDTLADGWVNTWTEEKNGKNTPVTFDSKAKAEIELNDFLNESVESFKDGDLAAAYEKSEFRIVSVTK